MKIEPDTFEEVLVVDVQTRRDGNSASKVAWDDSTEVYVGGLHASVRMRDLHLHVVMNPDEGQWRHIPWARKKAMEAICQPEVAPLVITAMARFHFDLGKKAGAAKVRSDLRKLIGIPQAIDDAVSAHTYGEEP